ncbi:unnamed protein product [Adineta ricciae]|uniref:Hydrogen voltage-gated channel 1 n=1 Tax=Adineta ricciae TaxID=249248 RepID=A0A815ZIT5_ADIRI|nr:unnamed protein product [Adineta ricciae]CAF1584679.1 unnamed protein product [Adineta ricciae]
MASQKKSPPNRRKTCLSKWWKQEYHCQQVLSNLIESFEFQALVIFLVVLDTSSVVIEILLDSFKIHYECKHNHHHASVHSKLKEEHVELVMEIAHYFSIGILTFFVIELLVRIFASGKEFWNIRRRKMQYLDAIIVITSLIIDLSFLRGEKKLLGEELILVLAFRLWRFVRIISSVAESTRHGQMKHKDRLNQQYLNAIRRLVELFVYKTKYIEKNANGQDFSSLLEHFQDMDQQCQSSLEALDKNRELTSSAVIEQFVDELNRCGNNKYEDSVLTSLLTHAPKKV